MLKLLKRCKSLVVSLLLCGCLVGFSSVSFAASATVQPYAFPWQSVIYIKSDTDSSVNIGQIVYHIDFGEGTLLSSSGYSSSGAMSSYNYSIPTMHTISITNYTGSSIRCNFSDFYLANQKLYVRSYGGANDLFNGSFSLDNIDMIQNNGILLGISGGRYTFTAHPDYSLNGTFAIPAYSTINIQFTADSIISLQSQAYYGSVTPYSFEGDLYFGNGSGTASSVDWTPGTLSGVNDSIDSQTQQQQQQHEEQMQQSQQQYDDFTDSGSSEGSDLITGTEDEIKEKIGIFTFLDNLIQRFLGLFVASDASTSITLPAFSMTIQGRSYQIWEEYTFDLSSLDGPFNVLMTAVRFATVATVYFAFLGYLQNTYKRIIGGSNG